MAQTCFVYAFCYLFGLWRLVVWCPLHLRFHWFCFLGFAAVANVLFVFSCFCFSLGGGCSSLFRFGRFRVRWGPRGPTRPNLSCFWCFWCLCVFLFVFPLVVWVAFHWRQAGSQARFFDKNLNTPRVWDGFYHFRPAFMAGRSGYVSVWTRFLPSFEVSSWDTI